MPNQFDERLKLLNKAASLPLLTDIRRGIEKESLRITAQGGLAQTPHPSRLGSPLTHPHITTDFSEALIELITPTFTRIDDALSFLDETHRFVYAELDDEELWVASMPCMLQGDDQIPVAQYGSSNVAKMKTVYRVGLGKRYGRPMQTIAGIHYNFSVPEALWPLLQQQDLDKRPLQDYITDAYFKLIRNFRRFSWLLVYLYGASPAVCNSFLHDKPHTLQAFDPDSLHLPFATSLRMGDLGYQSHAQENLPICYNSLDNYIETLHKAITIPQPEYEKIGLKGGDDYLQLSTALLQIENEFYSPIRPKRVTQSGEIPLGALRERGVEYIEVRCIDLNPYLPLGIDADQIRFLDSFLLYCLLESSRLCDDDDRMRINNNLKKVVNTGRQPELSLERLRGDCSLLEWSEELLTGIEQVAALLDQAHGGGDYQRVCQQQRDKLANPELTPSARLLADMTANQKPFFRHIMDLSLERGQYFRERPLDDQHITFFSEHCANSKTQQAAVEAADKISFENYLQQYFQQYESLRNSNNS